MKFFNFLKFKKNKFLYIIGTLFLSSLSTPIWEKIISPTLNFTANILINIYNYFYNSYTDKIYLEVSRMNKEIFSETIFLYSILLLIGIPFILYLRMFPRNDNFMEKYKDCNVEELKELSEKLKQRYIKIKKILKIALILFTINILLFIPLTLSKVITHDAILYMQQNIEIISPYINDHELITLKSKLRLIDSKSSFFKLDEEIISIAKKNNINLPEYKLIY